MACLDTIDLLSNDDGGYEGVTPHGEVIVCMPVLYNYFPELRKKEPAMIWIKLYDRPGRNRVECAVDDATGEILVDGKGVELLHETLNYLLRLLFNADRSTVYAQVMYEEE